MNRQTTRLLGATLVLCALIARGATAQTLASGWATSDIGAVGVTGSADGGNGSFTVAGAGADIWGTTDAFRYLYMSLTGDGSITARVNSLDLLNEWTKAGVMMRDTLSPGSAHAFAMVSATRGVGFQRRLTASGLSAHTGLAGRAPYYVRLTRAGNLFTAFVSPTGTSWTAVGSATIAMSPTIYVGLAVTSHVAGSIATASFSSVAITGQFGAPPTTTKTMVFFRHGEKPAGGYGQITCQGLRRALALPPVLLGRFGSPQFLFAPNPLPRVTDPAGNFHYVRPLATIEPLAIRLGMPVNAQYGYTDIAGLQTALLNSTSASALIFVAWEHQKLYEVVQSIMNFYNAGVTVPAWNGGDYDSLYIVRVTNNAGQHTATFERDYQGLNGLATSCP